MKPLPRKTRKIMFVFFFVAFLFLSPFVLAKSFGYGLNRIDDIFKLTKTGGIFVNSDISGVNIYLDGKYHDKSGLFIRNVLIQKLLPEEEYEIVVQKDGLNDWRKILKVYPSLVTEASLLMLPKDIARKEITDIDLLIELGFATKTTDVLDPDLVKTEVGSADPKGISISTKNTLTATTSTTTKEKIKIIPPHFEKLDIIEEEVEKIIETRDQVFWLDEGDIFIGWFNSQKIPPHYYCLDFNVCREKISIDWDNEIIDFDLFPGREDVLIVLFDDGLFAVEIDDRSERNIQTIYIGQDLKFTKNNRGQIFVADNEIFYQLIF